MKKEKGFSRIESRFNWGNSGFSLIQLLTVIAFFAAIGTFLWVQADPSTQISIAKDTQRKKDLALIKTALDAYYQSFYRYPSSTDSDSAKPFRIEGFQVDHKVIDWGENFDPYLVTLPKDPDEEKQYVYYSTGQSYYLYASLDRGGKDPDSCHPDGSVCDHVPDGASCGLNAICNYGISSPNVYP